MTVTIRKVKDKAGYFALCAYNGIQLTPLLIMNDYDFIVSFCKAEGYTWYYNLSDDKAVTV